MAAAQGGVPPLYVGDLHADVADDQLFLLFSSVGAVGSVRVCRNTQTGISLGYGYVNFLKLDDATRAIDELNHTQVNGKRIRVMWSDRDPDARRSTIGNLFVKNLAESIDNVKLHKMFSSFGAILSCKVAITEEGRSKGYGFVHFHTPEAAVAAIESLNGTTVEGKELYVANFIKKSDRMMPNPDAKYTNLYMKNLDQDITEDLIELKFSQFGKILKVAIAKDADGNSKGFGFVNFGNHESAKRAFEAMNGLQLGTKTLYVARAQKRAERQQYLKRLYEEKRNEQIMKSMASNVYVKNIEDDVDDETLREHFSKCGTITSAKVMLDEKGRSKGFAFVCFSSPEEANQAVLTFHGYMFHGKPLYVAFAQKKEDRRAHLQHQYTRRLSGFPGSPTPVAQGGYSPMYYAAQGVVSQVPPRQGLLYQPLGLGQGWRPGGFISQSRHAVQPMHLPVVPMPRHQRQNRNWMNGHMLAQSGHSMQYAASWQQSNYSLNSLKDTSSQQRSGHNRYVANGHQREMNNGSVILPSSSQGTDMLSSKLASASPQQQKQILGEQLFPLVQKQKFDLAAKITGMLLEMDNSELLLLLESPDSLAAKVEEAVQVLKLSKPKVGGQENLKLNLLSSEVAVN